MPRPSAQQSKNKTALYAAVRTPENLAKIEDLIAKGVPLRTIFEVHLNLPYIGRQEVQRRLPELAQALDLQKLHTKQPKYRLILGLEHTKNLGVIALTASTPEELWQSSFIRNYFSFYKLDPDRYEADYLRALHYKGVHYLSHLYAIAHCKISYAGRVQIVPTSSESDPEQT